jgi:two-component system, sensor histidine kinase and response regulator
MTAFDPPPIVTTHTGPLSGITVLVVEDNLIDQKVSTKLLSKAGATVLMALNGQEALDQCLLHSFDVILMDLCMPMMDGYQAAQHLRKMPETVTTPILAITATNIPNDEAHCLSLGMNAYILKPVMAPQLIATVLHWARQPVAVSPL